MRYPKILKRLKSNYINRTPIYGFDVETEQIDQGDYIEQRFLMGSIVGDDMCQVFWNAEEMRDQMMNNWKFRKSILMATNLDFDYTHLFQNSKDNKKVHKIYRNGSMIYGKMKQSYHRKTEFLDTWNYTGTMKLSKMGDMINLKKLPPPKCFKRRPENQEEKREMRNYNIRDSMITQKFGSMLQNYFNTMGCRMKITIASTGLDYWRRKFQPHDMFQEREEWLRKHYQGSFHGGRVEVIKRGLIEDAYYYDYNSHYPARCYEGVDKRGSYPDPNSVKYTTKGDTEIISDFEGISKVKIKCPDMHLPLLGTNSMSGKYIFPTGIIEGWYSHIELREAMDVGYEMLDVGECIYYGRTFVPFRNVVKKLYPLKAKYKKEGQKVMSMMVKTMMNAGLFGKFMQKLEGFEEVLDMDDLQLDDIGRLCRNTKDGYIPIDEHLIRNDIVFVKKEKQKIPLFTFPILSSYTTAMGRLKLWQDFSKHSKYLAYMDTDSGILTKKVFSSSDGLGELELEHKIDHAIFIRPKFYYLKDTDGKEYFKSKGIGKYINDKTMFDNTINTGVVGTERFSKVKESGIRKIPYSSIIKVDKRLSLEDDKRLWSKRFNMFRSEESEPHSLSMGMTKSELQKSQDMAMREFKRSMKSELNTFINSDKFDKHSVGVDIDPEEFIENEIFFETL